MLLIAPCSLNACDTLPIVTTNRITAPAPITTAATTSTAASSGNNPEAKPRIKLSPVTKEPKKIRMSQIWSRYTKLLRNSLNSFGFLIFTHHSSW